MSICIDPNFFKFLMPHVSQHIQGYLERWKITKITCQTWPDFQGWRPTTSENGKYSWCNQEHKGRQCFASLLLAATFWQTSPYHRTIPSCYCLKSCKTFTSLTSIIKSWFSQKVLTNIFTLVEGRWIEMLAEIWECFWRIQHFTALYNSLFSLHKQKLIF